MVLKKELGTLLALSSVHCIIQSADVLNDVHGSVNQRPAYVEKIDIPFVSPELEFLSPVTLLGQCIF